MPIEPSQSTNPFSSQTPFDPNLALTAPPPIGTPAPGGWSARVLEPTDRIVEVLCGLIMVLTFTLATPLSDRSGVHSMLIAALGCNFAWGIVDAAVYLMTDLGKHRSAVRTLTALRKTTDPAAAHRIAAEALPPLIRSVLLPADIEAIQMRLNRLSEPAQLHLSRKAWRGALGVFLLVFLSTFPVVIPFAAMRDVRAARFASNLIAIIMLFLAGCSFGRTVGYHPMLIGFAMVAFGGALVLTTIALGG